MGCSIIPENPPQSPFAKGGRFGMLGLFEKLPKCLTILTFYFSIMCSKLSPGWLPDQHDVGI